MSRRSAYLAEPEVQSYQQIWKPLREKEIRAALALMKPPLLQVVRMLILQGLGFML
jgi:hypothetical protein